MIKVTPEGKKFLDRMFGRRNITDLHIFLKGYKCGMSCLYCKCCHGQIQIESKPGPSTDIHFSAEGYNFSVAPELINKAEELRIDACGGIEGIAPKKPIYTPD